MAMAKNFEIECPCCHAQIVVDRISGEILLHKEKPSTGPGSFESIVSQMSERKSETAKRFEKELQSQKDRSRILEEKFKEALQRAEKSTEKHVNPFDLD